MRHDYGDAERAEGEVEEAERKEPPKKKSKWEMYNEDEVLLLFFVMLP